MARSDTAIADARGLGHQPSLAVTLAFGARLLLLLEDDATLAERASQLIAMSSEQSFAYWRALGTIYGGWVRMRYGKVTEGISLIRSGSTAYRATGAAAWVPFHLDLLSRAYEAAGQIDEAATLLAEALQIIESTGERWFAAELNRHKGQLLLRQGHCESAEKSYSKALTIAREHDAKLWELRAALSVARLRRDQGRHAEARGLLAPVYRWFTEGFHTSDLKEAKAMLTALEG